MKENECRLNTILINVKKQHAIKIFDFLFIGSIKSDRCETLMSYYKEHNAPGFTILFDTLKKNIHKKK